ncbi:NAD(P)/FAD-dependent oxidoreductase [Hydrogenovibrio sp. JE_KL2]|uniref:NAD(P)/FAD-dependent oxidoreductase n=1 Tax=Hydrogenovibrio sp. JE_KL2 TaxID=2651188 RepID=UPI00128D1DDF|nr:FAD-dependent oxidoreductase [Hydrogenovibrio sp. JE_KL2]MPQ77130.1 pyridine nucleotide-disulfide oxidoreductase [Hydrogenovibrio sp. JE_KL2]
MSHTNTPHVLILGGNFAGLGSAQAVRKYAGKDVNITVIDRKNYLLYVPNISTEIFESDHPELEKNLTMDLPSTLAKDNVNFIQGEVTGIDVNRQRVKFNPAERPGAEPQTIEYDFLVVSVGCELAYEDIEGFAEYGDTVSDFYHAKKLFKKLTEDYHGGNIVVGSALFKQGDGAIGLQPYPGGSIPSAKAACEGPPVEVSLSLANWLNQHGKGGPDDITITTPAEMIAEDAGEDVVTQLLEAASSMGFKYVNNTGDIKRLTEHTIEYENGQVINAEIKILFPNWKAYDFLKNLPIADNEGFIVTDLYMRNPTYRNVFAAGDCAAVTVPKLGAIGHQECDIVGRQIAKDLHQLSAEKADVSLQPVVFCIGDMGDGKAFYIHSNSWFGGPEQKLVMGHVPHFLKMQYKRMFMNNDGKVPPWGLDVAEVLAEKIAV